MYDYFFFNLRDFYTQSLAASFLGDPEVGSYTHGLVNFLVQLVAMVMPVVKAR